MFVRNVSLYLKPHSLPEFLRLMDSEVIPLLRKQKGFQDAITLAVPGGREIVAVSFWEQEENARAYTTTGYLEVLKIPRKTPRRNSSRADSRRGQFDISQAPVACNRLTAVRVDQSCRNLMPEENM